MDKETPYPLDKRAAGRRDAQPAHDQGRMRSAMSARKIVAAALVVVILGAFLAATLLGGTGSNRVAALRGKAFLCR